MHEAYEKVYYCIAGNTQRPFSANTSPQIRCKELGIDPNKGCMLIGGTGVGKTILFSVMDTVFENSKNKSIRYYPGFPDFSDEENIREVLNEFGGSTRANLLIESIKLNDLYELQIRTLQQLVSERFLLYKKIQFKTHISFRLTESKYDSVNETVKGIVELFGKRFYEQLLMMNNRIIWEDNNLRRLNIYSRWQSKAETLFKSL